MLDMQSLPVSGGFILGTIAYVGFSVFIAGPLVAERTIENHKWPQICERQIRKNLELSQSVQPGIPDMKCNSLFGFHPGLSDICARYGNPTFSMPFLDVIQQQQERVREIEKKRLDNKAAQATSQCGCAASIVADNRTAWGLYAGSARLVEPSKVKNLNSELVTALNSPRCQFADN